MRHRLALLMLVLWPLMATAQTTVSGRITDRDTGAPIHGLRVDLRTIYNTEPAAPLATWTDTDGRYTLADVPPGRWRIGVVYALPAAEHLLATPPIDAGDGPFRFDFEIPTHETWDKRTDTSLRWHPSGPPQAQGLTVGGEVLSSPYEFPIDGATVRLLSAEDEVEGGRHYRTAATAVTDADGRFRLEALAAGRYLALVTHAAYDTLRNHAIDLETPGELTVFLARPGAAPSPDPRPSFGRVLDGEGRPLTETISSAWYQTKGTLVGRVLDGALPAAGAEVQLAGHAAVSTGADGGYVLSDLEPGTYTLEVRYQGAATTLPGVVVMAGRNEIDLRLADE